MPRWLALVLARIHRFAATGAVHITSKAAIEARALGFRGSDILILRADCVVISFHPDSHEAREEDD